MICPKASLAASSIIPAPCYPQSLPPWNHLSTTRCASRYPSLFASTRGEPSLFRGLLVRTHR